MKAFRLEGTSMLPVFRRGETALVSPERPRPGDCAVYSWQGRTLLHRAVSVSADGALFADDAGRLDPHHAPWSDISGRVVSSNPLASGVPGLVYHKFRRGLSRLLRR